MKSASLLLLLLSLFGAPTIGNADEPVAEGALNRLLAPGPLMKGHQELESSDCLKCHEVGKGDSGRKMFSGAATRQLQHR